MFWQPDHECPSVSSLSGLKLVDVFLRRNETGVRATCVLVVSLACLRRPPALIARRGVREMMAPRKHEGVLPLQRARGERGRVAGHGVVSGCATRAAVPQLALHSCLWTHCI